MDESGEIELGSGDLLPGSPRRRLWNKRRLWRWRYRAELMPTARERLPMARRPGDLL
jgi:hypothetical protein